MKKLLITVSVFTIVLLNAQQGNVGINTDTPEARLEIQSSGNTATTSAMIMKNTSNSTVFKLQDNGFLGVNHNTPEAPLHISGVATGGDLLITRTNQVLSFDGVSHTPSFRHLRYASGASFNNMNLGGQLFVFDVGAHLANPHQVLDPATNTYVIAAPTNGISILPVNAAASAGLFIASNGHNGFSLNRAPTVRVDVGGSIRLREVEETVTANASCTGRTGEIVYYRGHFYGCATSPNQWKQLDN